MVTHVSPPSCTVAYLCSILTKTEMCRQSLVKRSIRSAQKSVRWALLLPVDGRALRTDEQRFIEQGISILSDNYQLPLPAGSLIVLTQPTLPTAHTRCAGTAGSDKRQLSDKIRIREQDSVALYGPALQRRP